jgi:hypothetical protein
MNNIDFFQIYNTNKEQLVCLIIVPFLIVLISVYFTTDSKKVINEKYEDNDNDNDNESVKSDVTSLTNDNEEISSDTSDDQYTSILYKSFLLMTKKQLLKITGNKYKNMCKDELIIIAINKFILHSIDNFKLMPSDAKNFVKKNKETMIDELYKLYKVQNKNEEECIQDSEETILNEELVVNS